MNEVIELNDINREWSNLVAEYIVTKIKLQNRIRELEAQLEDLQRIKEISEKVLGETSQKSE